MKREFRIVTHKSWLAELFAEFGGKIDYGFDIDPATAMDTIWWAPGAWVASALKAGVKLPLMSCGPRWLSDCPKEYTGRWVETLTVKECINEEALVHVTGDSECFLKLPEAKLDCFPARVHTFNRHWATTVGQYNLPDDALIQIQTPVNFHSEARCYILHSNVVQCCIYRIGETIWDGDELIDLGYIARFWDFASKVARTVPGPPSYVLDVGLTTDDQVLVVEANAAWSSGPYGCTPLWVKDCIEASHDFEGEYPQWAWNPNPALYKAGPLKVVSNE